MKILLIEDDKFFRDFYSFKLREMDVEVDVAVDGEEGLLKVAVSNPHVILLDLIMPKKNGFDVLEALSKDGITNQIPVLVFSTLEQKEDIDKAMQLGAKGYVNKSFFDFENLYNKILELTKPA